MTIRTLAFVGAAGGVGTTRVTVEAGATLARAGWDVAIFDAAYATQGLARYVPGSLDVDVTTLVTEEVPLKRGLYPLEADVAGTLSLCPARAPFERLTRAQTAGAAERFEQHLAAAALSHDVVLVDTPPVNSNQALAAVNTADSVAVVTSGTERGAGALSLMQERLADVGSRVDSVIVNRADDAGRVDADAVIPASDVVSERRCPVCVEPAGRFAPAVARATEDLLDTALDLEFSDGSRFGGLVGSGS